VVEGIIKGTKCSGGSTLELALNGSIGEIELYSDRYPEISYGAANYTPQGVLDPCVDLKGRHARITYHPAKCRPNWGEMMAVELVKD
jgi:hypothetical protein